jgi:IclR family acetate operon transcriptional repressor
MQNGETGPNYPIESVANALRLLLAFKERPSVGVSEAARELGVARSTAHRLLAQLAHFDFVAQDPRTKNYTAGPALFDLGQVVAVHDDVEAAAHRYLVSLVATFGETAHTCVMQGHDVLFLDGVESTKALRSGARAGTVLPAHATSGGKVMLAAMRDDVVRERYPDESLHAVTRRTIRTRSALIAELHAVRKRGYATNFGESEPGLSAISCLIRSRNGAPRAALTIAGPETRFRHLDLDRMAAAAQGACDAVSAALR